MQQFWSGMTFGIIGTLLPSLVAFAALLSRAPELDEAHMPDIESGWH